MKYAMEDPSNFEPIVIDGKEYYTAKQMCSIWDTTLFQLAVWTGHDEMPHIVKEIDGKPVRLFHLPDCQHWWATTGKFWAYED